MAKSKTLSLLDAFVTPQQVREMKGGLKFVRNRKQASAPTEEAKPEEPKPEETKPEETPTAEPVKADEPQAQEAKAWTPLEDAALLGLKAQNKSWKEIGEIILGRDKDELLNRYKELSPNTTADRGKDKDNSVNGAKDVTGGKGKTGKGAGEQKGQAKNDGPTDGAGEQAAKGPVLAGKPGSNIKGILKKTEDGGTELVHIDIDAEATEIDGCPIIYIDTDEELTLDDVRFECFYDMLQAFEENKWLRMVSRFFDMTGKRVGPDYLAEKMKNCVKVMNS
ncbi:MAG: hypothetical protein LQ342_004318 [Letrouitia transgressa]|nr:MAG: hypothetical protein LQ342_004318 [Letrouitia transgressa]